MSDTIKIKPSTGAIKRHHVLDETWVVRTSEFYNCDFNSLFEVCPGHYVNRQYLVPVAAVEVQFH